jgi:hypothetical protein
MKEEKLNKQMFLHKRKSVRANVPQCSEAYLLVETKTARLNVRPCRYGRGRAGALAKK